MAEQHGDRDGPPHDERKARARDGRGFYRGDAALWGADRPADAAATGRRRGKKKIIITEKGLGRKETGGRWKKKEDISTW